MNETQAAARNDYVDKLRPHYVGFIEKLAEEYLATKNRYVASWEKRRLALYFDSIAVAYMSWQCVRTTAAAEDIPLEYRDELVRVVADGLVANDDEMYKAFFSLGPDPVDERRVREAIIPYVTRESDADVFVAMCKQLWRDEEHLQVIGSVAGVDDDEG